jgi:hypothetical protein
MPTKIPKFDTVEEEGRKFLEIGRFLVCQEDLEVPSGYVDGFTVSRNPNHPEMGQYFRHDAAIIHAHYQGLAVPTAEQWLEIILTIHQGLDIHEERHPDTFVRKVLGLKLGGCSEGFRYRYQRSIGLYWVADHEKLHGLFLRSDTVWIAPLGGRYCYGRLLARCIKA